MSQSMSAVRVATPADEEALLRHCQMHHAETGVYGVGQDVFPLDDDMVRAMLHRTFNRQGGIIGVIGTGTDLEASICLLITTLWHTKAYHIEELWTFVHPDRRKTKHAKALSEFAKACARELDVPLIGGLITNDKTESKLRLYQRTYGYPRGAFFVFNPADEPQAERPTPGAVLFWDNPFPRPGVSVIETSGLSQEQLAALSRMKSKRGSNGTARHVP